MSALSHDAGFKLTHLVEAQRGLSPLEIQRFLTYGELPELHLPPLEERLNTELEQMLAMHDDDDQVLHENDARAVLDNRSITAGAFLAQSQSHSEITSSAANNGGVERNVGLAFKFDPKQPRGRDGKWSKVPGSGLLDLLDLDGKSPAGSKKSSWQPAMKSADANKFAKNSKIKKPLYHGTSKEAASSIKKDGFKEDKVGAGGTNVYGAGLYLTAHKDAADSYAQTHKGSVVEFRANVENPVHDTSPDMARAQVAQEIYSPLVVARNLNLPEDEVKSSLSDIIDAPISPALAKRFDLPETTTKREFVALNDDELDSVVERASKHKGSGSWLTTAYLQHKGYDGVIVGNPDRPSEVVVFDPKQVVAIDADAPDVSMPDVDVPSAKPKAASPAVASTGKKTTPAIIYKKHADGAIVGQSESGDRRMRWDADRKKFIVEQDKNGEWVEQSALTKTAAYNDMKQPDRWFEPGQSSQTSTKPKPSTPPQTPEPSPADSQPTVESKQAKPKKTSAAKLTPQERAAIKKWQGADHSKIQKALRTGDTTPEVALLDSAIEKSPPLGKTTLYRGLTPDFMPDDLKTPGKIFTDLGYLATSKSKPDDTMFESYNHVIITIPDGTKGLDVGSGPYDEVLLPRGSRLRIDRVEQTRTLPGSTSPLHDVHATLLADDKTKISDAKVALPETKTTSSSGQKLSKHEEQVLAGLESGIADLLEESKPWRELEAKYTHKTGTGGWLSDWELKQQDKARAKLKELTDAGTAMAEEQLELLMKRDGTVWGEVDSVNDATRWANKAKPSTVMLPGVDSAKIDKIADSYRINDKKTIEHNMSIRSGNPSQAAKSWRSRTRRMIKSQKLLNDAVAYRGAALTPERILELRPGSVMIDPGSMSTDEDRDIAEFYAKVRLDDIPGTLKTIFEIRAPKGAHVADVHYGEFVFDFDAPMRIISSSRENGTVNVVAELLTPEQVKELSNG